MEACEEDEILEPGNPQVEAAVAGGDKADHPPHPLRRVGRVHGHDRDVARGRCQEAGERPDQGRLAGAVRPEERVDLAGRDAERDVAQGEVLPVRVRDAVQSERRRPPDGLVFAQRGRTSLSLTMMETAPKWGNSPNG